MPSDLDGARAAIEARIKANWTTTPVAWAGKTFRPPDGPWVEPAVVWGEGAAETHDGMGEVAGVLNCNLFGKPGKGYGELNRLADDFRDLFHLLSLPGITFDAASGPRAVIAQEQSWLQVNITVPFSVTETA